MNNTFEIKWGLGTTRKTGTPIKLWHVVVNGRTVATLLSEDRARAYIVNRYGHVPLGRKS